MAIFWVIFVCRVQLASDLHPKFALRPHYVSKYIQCATVENRRGKKDRKKKKEEEETTGWKYNGMPYSIGRHSEKTQTCVVRACAKTRIMIHEGRMRGERLHEVGKECTCWATWWKEGTQKNNWRQQKVAKIVKSWKSYTRFSADYLSQRESQEMERTWALSVIVVGGGGRAALLWMTGDATSVGSELPDVDILDPVRTSCCDELTDAAGEWWRCRLLESSTCWSAFIASARQRHLKSLGDEQRVIRAAFRKFVDGHNQEKQGMYNHILSIFDIVSSNWNALGPAFLQSSDSVVEELLLFQRAICRADNVFPGKLTLHMRDLDPI